MVVRDRKVDAVVRSFSGDRALPTGGWTVDRCDVVVLVDAAPKAPEDWSVPVAWLDAVRMLRPRSVVANADDLQMLKQYGLAKALLEALLAREA